MNRRALLAYLKSRLGLGKGPYTLSREDLENIVRVLTDGGKGTYAARLERLEDEIARLKQEASNERAREASIGANLPANWSLK